jgi:hypothetical protein
MQQNILPTQEGKVHGFFNALSQLQVKIASSKIDSSPIDDSSMSLRSMINKSMMRMSVKVTHRLSQ